MHAKDRIRKNIKRMQRRALTFITNAHQMQYDMRLTFASAIAKDLEMDERKEEGINIFYDNLSQREFGEVADKVAKYSGIRLTGL